jgi:hypothetical protein
MKIRTQRKLANAASVILALLGMGLTGWVLCLPVPNDSLSANVTDNSRSKARPIPNIKGIAAVLNKKLQGPLILTVKKPVASSRVKPTRTVQWPPVSLDCIIANNDVKVAAFSSGQETFNCELGDEFRNISVKQITLQSVDLIFAGQTKTFWLNGKIAEKGDSR